MKILIICGGGACSGFLAQKMRQAAKKKGVVADVETSSYSILQAYIDEVDCVLIGPYLKFDQESIASICKSKGILCDIIDQAAYVSLNGEAVLEQANWFAQQCYTWLSQWW